VSPTRLPVFDRRRAGVLLALSALEAPLGRGGRAFIDWLSAAGYTLWQVLPVGPTGGDGSPYWVRSDHAGNPALLDPTELPAADEPQAAQFRAASAAWLPDYALFEALARAHGEAPFWQWPVELRDRDPPALLRARADLAGEIGRVEREQYAFHVQWLRLRAYARARGVRLFGDLPVYVAPSCVETWCHRGLFQLTGSGAPAAVGGVPPDYFSPTGQMWGNPLYDWAAMRAQDFAWWVARVGAQLARLDLLRLDHFRGLVAHWAIPAGAADARAGAWQPSPGAALLGRLKGEFADLPLVAEDLGVITEDVVALMQHFALPGMRVLQFAFDGNPGNPHLPYEYGRDCLAYTGTHDNDTAMGWYASLDPGTRQRVDFFLAADTAAMPQALVRAALGSVARLAVIPVQDLLGLGSGARFNTPSTTVGNWQWKVPQGALTGELAQHCARLNASFGRS
jgi:4-alpha-glucanotransferase